MARTWILLLATCAAQGAGLGCGSAEDAALPPGGGGYTKDGGADTGTKDGAAGGDGSVKPDGSTLPDGSPADQVSEPVVAKCTPGLIDCKSNVKRLCKDDGTWGDPEDCGALICSNLFGCVTCLPGTGSCDGNTAHQCKGDGSGFQDFVCDPVIGSSCVDGECTGPCAPDSLGKSYIGCDYYPTVTPNTQLANGSANYAVAVSNTTASDATVTVTQGANQINQFTVPANSVQVVPLPWTALKGAASTTMLASGAYRLRSTQPVTVYQFNPLEYTTGGGATYTNDASLLMPVTAWGTQYMVASRNTWQWSGFSIHGFYAVVASQDGTTVTLKPSATGAMVFPGSGVNGDGTGQAVLNSGDVLLVESTDTPAADPTGTRVEADKPIQVIGGHDCTFIPASVGYCDHIEEAMFPISTLSSEYIVSPPSLPGMAQPKPFFVRVIAVEPGTTMTYDPPNGGWPAALANAGDYVEIDSGSSFRIKASARVLVSQYMKGQDAGGGSGDPAMALAVTTAQFRKDYLFHAPVNYETNYVNITAPMTGTVTLDGAPVSVPFEAVGGTGLGVARVQFGNSGNGNHRVSADVPVGITVYGYGSYTSYWYPGGLNLSDL